MAKKGKQPPRNNGEPKKKVTKEERRAKYTQIARDRREKKVKQERNRNITCYTCRQPGHTANECKDGSKECCCYKCGELTHSLKECTKYNAKIPLHEQELPYAKCFVCKATGHLASQCDKNDKGIYVNGGSCHKCGSNMHRSTACPTARKEKAKVEEVVEENYDDLLDAVEKVGTIKPIGKNDLEAKVEGDTEKPKLKRKIVQF